MSIRLVDCSHAFGSTPVLHGVQLSVPKGEFVALLGPSGSGKSTLLRLVAGLEPMQHGQLFLDGEDCSTTPVQRRGVGLVFQHYALFPHLNVFDNIAFGLRLRARRHQELTAAHIREKVAEMLELVELSGLASRRPSELSGGQQQRVALARALVVEPRVLLLDEPFGALDARVRTSLRREVRELHDRLNMTTLLVTHDQSEAVDVADRLVLLNEGHVVQEGPPDTLFSAPADPFVCEFLGEVNWLTGRAEAGVVRVGEQDLEAAGMDVRGQVRIGVRPRQFTLNGSHKGGVEIVVHRVRHLGRTTRIEGRHGDQLVLAEVARGAASESLAVGEVAYLHIKRAHVFSTERDPSGPRSVLATERRGEQANEDTALGEMGLVS